jgi:hypothetical protein
MARCIGPVLACRRGREAELLYIVAPSLSGIDHASGTSFVDGMQSKLQGQSIHLLERDSQLGVRPGGADAVVVFNPSASTAFRPTVRALLDRALADGALVLPVALDEHRQQPRVPLADLCPFAVHEVLSRLNLSPSQLGIAGDEFARRVLVELWPTCSKRQLQLFVSYRRSDAEQIARELDRALLDLQEHPVRDLAAFRTGRAIKHEIVEKPRDCDVLIFLDTPRAPSSDWVRWELALAMGMAIPIVWVQLGERPNRDDLPVWPSQSPDLIITDAIMSAPQVRQLALDIRGKAFETALAHVRRACATLARIRNVDHLAVEPVEPRRQIYCVSRPRQYRGRPAGFDRHVVQVFGRRPSLFDRAELGAWLRAATAAPGGRANGSESAFLLSSSPMAADHDETVITTDGITYVEEMSGPSLQRADASNAPELLLLSAFPRREGSAQEVREAVHEIATTWLSRGGRLRFGGHPSITPIANGAAEVVIPGQESQHVRIYQSRYFVTSAGLEEIAASATVVDTEAGDDRDASLTIMRTRMIGDGPVAAAVAVGGRTTEHGDHRPGVEEEFEIARAHGIPVYLIGRPGGYTASLVELCRADAQPWARLGNAMSAEENEALATTDDYWEATRMIWQRHGS